APPPSLTAGDAVRLEPYQPLEIPMEKPPAADEPVADQTERLGVAPSNIVRVDLSRLDELMRMVGELVISRARLGEELRRLEAVTPRAALREAEECALAIEHQLRELREAVMRTRLVPIGELFSRMRFVVRDLARTSGKKIELSVSGQETEIDKFVVERMMDPLLHLVRNSVSHGLETPAERLEAGKPETGMLTLRAFTAGESVVIEVEDDGRGMDFQRIAERAAALGILRTPVELDARQALEVICSPGFTTREEADRASGRGMGMLAVRQTLNQLGGSMRLETQPGQGTRFTIELPLTLVIVDAILVQVGEQAFAVPQTAVAEVMEVPREGVTRLEKNELLPHRGGVLPLLRLRELFRLDDGGGPERYALVVTDSRDAVALGIDALIGQRQVVVRPLSDPLVRVPGIAGATELGDGRAVLILDAGAFVGMARLR
ncbi:MAG: chemotaxis protein CheW, partial [Armatimonadota bacterium]|nr:chemotaxis protein CheW [Armatimonadota bacterium]